MFGGISHRNASAWAMGDRKTYRSRLVGKKLERQLGGGGTYL